RGGVVSVEVAAVGEAGRPAPLPIRPAAGGSKAERLAALEAFLSTQGQGWRSERPYGPREDLYEG
ncbi:MAG: hypothetical protein KXJ53_04435, partial [Phenylobacterium sp.]|nr:hypothetical protein [Phenylobacterium sp.]